MNKDIMKKMGFEKEVKMVENNICPTCGKHIFLGNGFRDDSSRKEFQISGMCQKCQDSFFGI